MVRDVFLGILAGAAVLTIVCGQPTQQCSEECVRSILDGSNGPRVLRLFRELMTPDGPEVHKVNALSLQYTPVHDCTFSRLQFFSTTIISIHLTEFIFQCLCIYPFYYAHTFYRLFDCLFICVCFLNEKENQS